MRTNAETGIIYLAINKINGKPYVGKTIGTLEVRRKSHEGTSRKNQGWVFHKAIRKYGAENFEWMTLSNATPLHELNIMERVWILLMNSQTPHGYNMTIGGDGIVSTDPKYRKRLSKIHKERCADPAQRKRLSEWSKDHWKKPGAKDAWITKRKPIMESEEYRAKLRARNVRLNKDPEYHKKLSTSIRAAHIRSKLDSESPYQKSQRNKERNKQISETLKKHYSEPKNKERLRQQGFKIWKDPKFRQKKSKNSSETMKRLWRDPEFAKKATERWADPEFKKRVTTKAQATRNKNRNI